MDTPDIAPQVAALTGADADCIVLSVTPTQVVQAVTALNQAGVDAQLIASGAVFTPDVVDELGDLAEGVVIADVQLNPADDDPVVDQITADMAAFDPDAEVSTVAVLSWASAKLIEDALPAVQGDVTPESLTAALNGLEDAPAGGAIHPVTVEELDNPLFTRVFNTHGLLYQITDGVPARLTEDWFSTEPVLEVASIG
jgi:ABC-type branched-subunit amino acid transport system substrate-binding protein